MFSVLLNEAKEILDSGNDDARGYMSSISDGDFRFYISRKIKKGIFESAKVVNNVNKEDKDDHCMIFGLAALEHLKLVKTIPSGNTNLFATNVYYSVKLLSRTNGKVGVGITGYHLQLEEAHSISKPITWELQGSLDGENWTTLSRHVQEMPKSNHLYSVPTTSTFYSNFRILQPLIRGNPKMILSDSFSFDVFGVLIEIEYMKTLRLMDCPSIWTSLPWEFALNNGNHVPQTVPLIARGKFERLYDFDQRGVLHFMKKQEQSIVLQHSDLEEGDISTIVDAASSSHPTETYTRDMGHSWISVSLPTVSKLSLQTFSLRHGSALPRHFLRYWFFQGSLDGDKWVTISSHLNDTSINSTSSFPCHSFQVPEICPPYQHFRILQNGPNSSGNNRLCLSGIELYGMLYLNWSDVKYEIENIVCEDKTNNNNNNNNNNSSINEDNNNNYCNNISLERIVVSPSKKRVLSQRPRTAINSRKLSIDDENNNTTADMTITAEDSNTSWLHKLASRDENTIKSPAKIVSSSVVTCTTQTNDTAATEGEEIASIDSNPNSVAYTAVAVRNKAVGQLREIHKHSYANDESFQRTANSSISFNTTATTISPKRRDAEPRPNIVKALLHACKSCNSRTVQQALSTSLNPITAVDLHGNSILHLVCEDLLISSAILRLLLLHGADISSSNDNGDTPAHIAAASNNIDALRELIHFNADINARNMRGLTPLHHAASNGCVSVVKTLMLLPTLDPFVCSYEGINVLHAAVLEDHLSCAALLATAYPDLLAARSEAGNTALHIAAELGSPNTIEMLLAAGAKPTATNSLGLTPFQLAQTQASAFLNRLKPTGMFIKTFQGEQSSEITQFIQEIVLGNLAGVNAIISAGIYLNEQDVEGNTLLHHWARYPSAKPDAISYLIEAGLDINTQGKEGNTALHVLCAHSLPSVLSQRPNFEKMVVKNIQTLLLLRADPGIQADDGATPLHRCSHSGVTCAVKAMLTDERTKMDLRDGLHRTAFHVAMIRKNDEIAKLLAETFPGVVPETEMLALQNGDWTPALFFADKEEQKRPTSSSGSTYAPLQEPYLSWLGCLASSDEKTVDFKLLRERDQFGKTVMHMWAFQPNHRSGPTVDRRIFTGMLNAGLSCNQRDMAGKSPMWYAADIGGVAKVSMLLSAKGDPNLPDNTTGCTPLHLAVDNADTAMVKLLISHKDTDGNAINSVGKTPLQLALEKNLNEITGMLLAAYPSVDSSTTTALIQQHLDKSTDGTLSKSAIGIMQREQELSSARSIGLDNTLHRMGLEQQQQQQQQQQNTSRGSSSSRKKRNSRKGDKGDDDDDDSNSANKQTALNEASDARTNQRKKYVDLIESNRKKSIQIGSVLLKKKQEEDARVAASVLSAASMTVITSPSHKNSNTSLVADIVTADQWEQAARNKITASPPRVGLVSREGRKISSSQSAKRPPSTSVSPLHHHASMGNLHNQQRTQSPGSSSRVGTAFSDHSDSELATRASSAMSLSSTSGSRMSALTKSRVGSRGSHRELAVHIPVESPVSSPNANSSSSSRSAKQNSAAAQRGKKK